MNKQDEQLEALKGKAAEDLAKPKKIELRAGPPTYPAPGRTVEEARAEIAKPSHASFKQQRRGGPYTCRRSPRSRSSKTA